MRRDGLKREGGGRGEQGVKREPKGVDGNQHGNFIAGRSDVPQLGPRRTSRFRLVRLVRTLACMGGMRPVQPRFPADDAINPVAVSLSKLDMRQGVGEPIDDRNLMSVEGWRDQHRAQSPVVWSRRGGVHASIEPSKREGETTRVFRKLAQVIRNKRPTGL